MISLIFIPLLFWYFGNAALKRLDIRVLDIGLPMKSREGRPALEIATVPKEGWTYKSVILQPNFGQKEEKRFENLIQKMVAENIPKTGIRFQFSDQNNYGDFVKILNLMLKTKQNMYGVDLDDNDSFYVLNELTFYKDDFIGCGTMPDKYYDQADYDYKKASFFTKVMKYSTKETYYLIFGFLLLVYASFFQRIL